MSKITKQITINAPAEKVWDIVADFGSISKWAPNVTNSYSTTEANGGVGAGRHCDVVGFGAIEEEIVEWKESRSLTYEVEDVGPIKSLRNESSVRGDGDRTVVTFTLDYQMKFGPLGALLDKLVAGRQLGKAAALGLAGLKHHVETGEPVDQKTKLPKSTLAAVTV
ncbi:MAG: SRPBCC family protein [Chloroflexi bacterium]|nr:SRPBCC family protein [Chloroflexota bacterium]